MKVSSMFRPFLCCLIVVMALVPGTHAQRKRQVAVLDFDFTTVDIGLARKAFGNTQNLARQVSVKLGSRLTNLGTCQVIERSQLDRILREQNFGMEGRLDPNTMAKIGKILGVDSFVLGNVTVFDLQGLPKSGQRQNEWDPNKMSARLQVSFRVVDTTTAYVEMSQEATGAYVPQVEKKGVNKKEVVRDILSALSNNGRTTSREPLAKVTDEQLKGVVEYAVDDVVSKISAALDSHFSNARNNATEPKPLANQINGRVIEANGPTVYIADINKSLVRRGDRLYVRRGRTKRDSATGKEYKFTEKIGEVEIVEIQDELVVGSFSGSQQVKEGDIITNNESGVGTSPLIRNNQKSPEYSSAPSPSINQVPAQTTPKPTYAPTQPSSEPSTTGRRSKRSRPI